MTDYISCYPAYHLPAPIFKSFTDNKLLAILFSPFFYIAVGFCLIT